MCLSFDLQLPEDKFDPLTMQAMIDPFEIPHESTSNSFHNTEFDRDSLAMSLFRNWKNDDFPEVRLTNDDPNFKFMTRHIDIDNSTPAVAQPSPPPSTPSTFTIESHFCDINAHNSDSANLLMLHINNLQRDPLIQGHVPDSMLSMGAPMMDKSTTPVPIVSSLQDESSTEPNQVEDETKTEVRFRLHQSENWTERFDELVEFQKKTGHCLVPNAFPENPSLAEWVKRQRYQYKLKRLGKHSTMSSNRVLALEKLGFVWNSHDQVWEERLKELKAYRQQFGDCHVPSSYTKNPQLAIWVKRQRRQYKFLTEGKPSTMTPYRVEKLSGIGFAWSGRRAPKTFSRLSIGRR